MKFLNLKARINQTLLEDGAFSDSTTMKIPGVKRERKKARVVAKAAGIFCGGNLASPLFKMLDARAKVKIFKKDGSRVKAGDTLIEIQAQSWAILGGERSYLNLAGRLSGISTLTRKYVEALRPFSVDVLDTRKTTPLWRDLEKWAVRCGGGINHRMSLKDAILVKDNHLELIRSKKLKPHKIFEGMENRRGSSIKFVEFEAQTYRDVWAGIKARADVIMLDNMSVEQIKGSVKFILAARKALGTSTPLIELSGGVNLKNIAKLARLGADRISIGALTHSAPSLDLSLEVL